jgi:hypothetical protein
MQQGDRRALIEIKDPLASDAGQEFRRDVRREELLVAAVHATSFVALLIITLSTLSRALVLPLWFDGGGVAIRSLGTFPISATLLPFPAITALFHLAQAFDVADYYQYTLVRGVTPHRWLEYSITNGLMMWSIYTLAGAGNILLPITGLFLNVLMQFFGYAHERANSGRGQHSLGYLLWGFVPWLALWLIPLTYYFDRAGELPVYYGVAIVGTFLLSLVFVAPLVWRYNTNDAPLLANKRVAQYYARISLTAKLLLDWTVVIGNLVETAH